METCKRQLCTPPLFWQLFQIPLAVLRIYVCACLIELILLTFLIALVFCCWLVTTESPFYGSKTWNSGDTTISRSGDTTISGSGDTTISGSGDTTISGGTNDTYDPKHPFSLNTKRAGPKRNAPVRKSRPKRSNSKIAA